MDNVNKKQFISREGGFIKYAILIIALLILIAYFRNDILKLWESPGVKTAVLTALGWISNGLAWLMSKLNWTAGQIK